MRSRLGGNLLWCLLVVLLCLESARALVNVTVSRDSGRILYEPELPNAWREAWPAVRISDDSQAKATLDFSGVALYYQGWQWTEPTSFIAKVDDRLEVTLDLMDARSMGKPRDPNATNTPTLPVTILIESNLTDTPHRVVLSKRGDQRDVIVGSLIYSTNNPPPTSSKPPPSPSATNDAPSGSVNLKIILPAVLGSISVVLLVCLLSFLWLRRRRQKKRSAADGWLVVPKKRSLEPSPPELDAVLYPQPIYNSNGRGFVGANRGERRVTLTGARRGVPLEDDFDPKVIQVTPADLGQSYRSWRIE